MLEEAWEGEGDMAGLLSEALPALERTLEAENREKVLRYVGLALEPAAR